MRQSPWVSLIVACLSCSGVLIFGLFYVKHGSIPDIRIPEGAKKPIWEVVSVFFQGGAAGLVILYFSEKIRLMRQKQFLKKYSDTMIIELEAHIAIWDNLIVKRPVLPEDIATLKEHTFWDKSLTPLESMSIEHFRIISFYFRTAYAILDRLEVRGFHDYQIQTMRLSAKQACCCFEFYTANSELDRATAINNISDLHHQLEKLDAMHPKE